MQRKIAVSTRLHKEDSTSIYLLLSKLQKEKYDPVLMYKPLNHAVVVGEDEIDDLPHAQELFAVGIQTKEQLHMMQDKEVICLDATHGTNQYGYKVLTLVVPDEFGKGYPVGHLISSHMDERTLYYFFKGVKNRCPSLKINVIMSDDDYSGPNAIKAVFGQEIKHLLCKWHIHRSWQRRLRSDIPGNPDLQEDVYDCLLLMLEEKNLNRFEELSKAFIDTYSSKCGNFVEHFSSYYMNRPETWAMCYRNFPHGRTDTNMFCESFHNRLKTFYLKRKANRRIDDLIQVLLRIEEDNFWRRNSDILYHSNSLCDLQPRHKRGVGIPDKDIEEVDNGRTWRVHSQSFQEVWYEITAIAEKCDKDLCFEKCQKLSCIGLCSHLYHCNCDDNHPICKHVHKVHSYQVRFHQQSRVTINAETGDLHLYTTCNEDVEADSHCTTTSQTMQEATGRYLAELAKMYNNEEVSRHIGLHLHGVLKQAVAQCKAITHETTQLKPMEPAVTISPNQQLQLQPMKKAKKRKTAKKVFTGPSSEKKRTLLEKLLHEPGTSDENNTQDEQSTRRRTRHGHNLESEPVSTVLRQSFTPPLSSVKSLGQTLIKHGPYNITMLHLKSLEPDLSSEERKALNSYDGTFVTGWLYDSVIDAFLYLLQQDNNQILCASSTTLTAYENGSSMRALWRNVDLTMTNLRIERRGLIKKKKEGLRRDRKD
ncbi:hypothetical protein Bbelb_394510 [Branchiostoma belcheri]|nr:hypothetical protein Bbelb_394510 [Branchiostoma belcheri]